MRRVVDALRDLDPDAARAILAHVEALAKLPAKRRAAILTLTDDRDQ